MIDLEKFVAEPVELCIYGKEGEDRAPAVKRKIFKLAFCPDNTHIRIYFDKHFFIAVPLTGSVYQNGQEWTAYDEKSALYYSIKKEGK